MKDGPHIARIAALIGDSARAEVLTALMADRALTATELADIAGVTKQTISAHLAKLLDAGLVAVESQGRHRYFRLDSVQEAEDSGIPYFLVGHVGDGNFHFGYLLDPNILEERVTAEDLNHKLVARALSMGGTCTGEHGVGLHKMGFLLDETGAGAVDMMRAIKRALDPKNILNPGKIFAL